MVITSNTAWSLKNYRLNLIAELIARKYQVVAVAPADQSQDDLVKAGVQFHHLEMDPRGKNPLTEILLLWLFFRFLHRERPDIILAFTAKPNIYCGLVSRLKGIPIINNITGLGQGFSRGGWLKAILSRLYKTALAASSRVFFQNKDDCNLFVSLNLVNATRTEVLPGSGVDLEHFRPIAIKPIQDTFTFLLVGRLLWEKGVGEYVAAARTIPEARFQIAGFLESESKSAIPEEQLNEWTSEGIIEYLGPLDDIRDAIPNSDCVVLPSYYREGVPRSLLEAAAMSRPVISCDTVGCREAVDDGISGMLCRPRDHHDLADKMRKMINLPLAARQKMGHQARAKMEREFDEKIIIARYIKVIEEELPAKS